MKNKAKKYRYSTLLLFGLTLLSCSVVSLVEQSLPLIDPQFNNTTETPEKIDNHILADRSFSSGEPCVAPCWYGIEINQTNQQEAMQILQGLPFVDVSSIKDRSTGWNGQDASVIEFNCNFDSQFCGGLIIQDDLVKEIIISVRYTLFFEDLLAQLGEPDHVSYGSNPGPQTTCFMGLTWASIGIYADYTFVGDYQPCRDLSEGGDFMRELQVEFLVYLDTTTYETNPIFCCLPWPGFESE